jgi:integrase
MNLASLLAEQLAERPVARITEEQYYRAIRCYSQFLGRPAVVADLETSRANEWLAAVAKRAAPRTVLNRKRGLTAVWNYATDRGLALAYQSRRLRRVRIPRGVVEAWSLDQVEALFAAAKALPGSTACGIPAALLMSAVCSIAYETGIRPSDWRRIAWDSIDLKTRTARFVQHKTGVVHVVGFSVITAEILERLRRYGRERVVPVGPGSIRRWEVRLFALAGERFGFGRRRGQGIGTLRKSHATAVYLEAGDCAAAESLGHVSGSAVAVRYYIASSATRDPYRIELPSGTGKARPRADRDVNRGARGASRGPRGSGRGEASAAPRE